MDRSAATRLVRVLVVTALVMCLAAAGHLAGGGTLPPLPAVLVCSAPALLAGRACARELSAPRLLGLLGATQVVLHEAFTVLSAPGACAGAAAHAHPGPGHTRGGVAGCVHVLAAAHRESPAAGALMLAGHAVAVVAAAVVLARIETALRRVLEWLRPLTAVPSPVALPAGPRRPPLPPARVPAPAWRGSFRLRVRGPPAARGA